LCWTVPCAIQGSRGRAARSVAASHLLSAYATKWVALGHCASTTPLLTWRPDLVRRTPAMAHSSTNTIMVQNVALTSSMSRSSTTVYCLTTASNGSHASNYTVAASQWPIMTINCSSRCPLSGVQGRPGVLSLVETAGVTNKQLRTPASHTRQHPASGIAD